MFGQLKALNNFKSLNKTIKISIFIIICLVLQLFLSANILNGYVLTSFSRTVLGISFTSLSFTALMLDFYSKRFYNNLSIQFISHFCEDYLYTNIKGLDYLSSRSRLNHSLKKRYEALIKDLNLLFFSAISNSFMNMCCFYDQVRFSNLEIIFYCLSTWLIFQCIKTYHSLLSFYP